MNALLDVVRRLADSGSVVGRRDYALLLFYFLTGLRRSEVIGLRGNDLESRDGTLVIKYRRKGGKFTAREISDPSAMEALKEYLEAAGRKNVFGSEVGASDPFPPAIQIQYTDICPRSGVSGE
jgi:integrase